MPQGPASARGRRPGPWFLALTVLGIGAIAFLAWREVSAIRAESRALEERYEAHERRIDDAMPDGPGIAATPLGPGRDVVIRLTEVQRPGPGVGGRYHLDVGEMRWALDTPAADADAAGRAAWADRATPRWAALRGSLDELTAGGAGVKAEIFAPWKDEPAAAPRDLLALLIRNLAAVGVIDVDVEHAPPDLVGEEGDR